MKKILSLVLAVAMLSTMAFAAVDNGNMTGTSSVAGGQNPGESLTYGSAAFSGKVYKIPGDAKKETETGALELKAGDLCNENFSISSKSFTKGAALVKSVSISDDGEVVKIELKQDYSLTRPANAANVVIKELSIKAKKAVGNAVKNQIYKMDVSGFANAAFVGYKKTPQTLTGAGATYDASGESIIEYKKNTDGTAYDIAEANSGDVYISGRVYAGDKVFLKVDSTVGDDQKAVLKLYENADLRFVSVITNGLPSNNDIQLTAEKDEFVYQIVDGKIAASGLKWSDDDYAWVGKIRTDKQFVISDIELKVTAGATGSENPDTGANDVVGVAAALAVVSVVAAAAVSLKK